MNTRWIKVIVVIMLTIAIAPLGHQTAKASPDLGVEFTISQKADRQMRTLDATWHAGSGQFLVVWSEHPSHSVNGGEIHSGDDEIRGALVDLDNTVGADFLISESGDSKDFPQVAHVLDTLIPEEQVSLVVWTDTRDGGEDIWGQLIDSTGGAKQGSNFKISGADPDIFPAIAYGQQSSGQGVFLVVWEREIGADDSEVYGQLIRGGGGPGTIVGSNFQISTSAAGYVSAPEVVFDPVNDRFLVVWTDDRFYPSDNSADIYGQLVNANGTLSGGNFQISSQAGAEGAPQALFHPEQNEYLVAWVHANSLSGNYNVNAQRVTAAGANTGGVINVATTGGYESLGDPTIDQDSGSYIFPLTTGANVGDRSQVEKVKLDASGTPVGIREMIATDTTANKGPTVAVYGSTLVGPGMGVSATSEVLIAWRDARSGVDPDGLLSQDVYGRMAEVKEDTDGDGLLDSWETNLYVDMNDNGVLDAGDFDFSTLPAANQPDVNHKDLYIEVDWMQIDADGDGVFCDSLGANCDLPPFNNDHSHGPLAVAGSLPTGTSFDVVITSFANAPVDNPDMINGINLHLDLGQMGGGGPSPEVVNLDFFAAGAANFENYKAANFDANRKRVFHYAVMKHEGSGRAEIWGNDFWLGAQYNTQALQALNLMHEFGHNLGLRHGGFENTPNCKPNHLSIMTYAFSTTGIPPTFRPDYSSQVLLQLDESNLDEGDALGDLNDHTGDAIDQTVFSAGGLTVGPNANTAGNVGIDWDNDGTGNESGAAVGNNDLNLIPVINGFNACRTASPDEILTGHDDWDNLRYNFRSSPNFDDNVHAISYPVENLDEVKVFWQVHYGDPDLALDKDGTLAGVPGDNVSYTITVVNNGPGPARNLLVEDLWPAGLTLVSATPSPLINSLNPDGSRSLTWSHETLLAGESLEINLSGTIDFPPVGDQVTQSVKVEGQNVLGEPQTALSDVVITDIQFPDMEMTKTASVSVNAGESITYHITYENVGDGDAANVTITDILSPGVYYSLALDLGAGPKPNSVSYNPDGSTTLRWDIGAVSGGSGPITIEYTARPGLLFFAGDSVANDVTLTYQDTNDNAYPQETASAPTSITAVPPSQDPRSLGFWRNHPELWAPELLARIQATDTRYDGVDGSAPDGQLSTAEVEAMFKPGGNQHKVLLMQLLATYFNMADRRINADKLLLSDTSLRLGLVDVRDAVIYAQDTLALPVNKSTRVRFSDANLVLDEINNNLSEVY